MKALRKYGKRSLYLALVKSSLQLGSRIEIEKNEKFNPRHQLLQILEEEMNQRKNQEKIQEEINQKIDYYSGVLEKEKSLSKKELATNKLNEYEDMKKFYNPRGSKKYKQSTQISNLLNYVNHS